MRIHEIVIHNFRSIKDVNIKLKNYSLLVGENNAGKTNIITAIRIFFNDDIQFDEKNDFPKFEVDGDQESWVEIHFQTTDEEQIELNENYRTNDNILKLRRYLKSDNYVKSNQSNIYGYENSRLSKNQFYLTKGSSKNKLGNITYIPPVSTLDETFKLSGPSPFRNIVNFVFNGVIINSPSFQLLNESVDKFNQTVKDEGSNNVDSISLKEIEKDMDEKIKSWGIEFEMQIEKLQPQEIVKSLFSFHLKDKTLGKDVEINYVGDGLQRYLIYNLIKLSSKYVKKKDERKTGIFNNFNLLLFEEPEVFLHLSQQVELNNSLANLANGNNQILISTHSPIFVSKNIEDLPSLVSVKKNISTKTFQLDSEDVQQLFYDNNLFFEKCNNIYNNPETNDSLKRRIKNLHLIKSEALNDDDKLNEESVEYILWIDSERASSLFAKHVIICEGATEKIAFNYLINTLQRSPCKRVYVLDAMGKYNIHRYMNLFEKLGISHSVLYDKDSNKEFQDFVNDFINRNKNIYTKTIDTFPEDIEGFLGINSPARKDQKPLNLLIKLKNNEIDTEKINKLMNKLEKLCSDI